MRYRLHTRFAGSSTWTYDKLDEAIEHLRVLWPHAEVDEPRGKYRACWATFYAQREKNPLQVVAAIEEMP